jgi:hypothetical protein
LQSKRRPGERQECSTWNSILSQLFSESQTFPNSSLPQWCQWGGNRTEFREAEDAAVCGVPQQESYVETEPQVSPPGLLWVFYYWVTKGSSLGWEWPPPHPLPRHAVLPGPGPDRAAKGCGPGIFAPISCFREASGHSDNEENGNQSTARCHWHRPLVHSKALLSVPWQDCGVTDTLENFFFSGTGVWTQGLALARQVLEPHSQPFYFSYFFNSLTILPGWAWDRDPAANASVVAGMLGKHHVAGITRVSHHAWPENICDYLGLSAASLNRISYVPCRVWTALTFFILCGKVPSPVLMCRAIFNRVWLLGTEMPFTAG